MVLTVARVPTGMNAGVSTAPCGVCSTPARMLEAGSTPRTSKRIVIVSAAKDLVVRSFGSKARLSMTQPLRTADFEYELPRELIAQEPIEPRDSARLLVLRRADNSLEHRHISDLPELLSPGDLLIANRSRVLPARIHGKLGGGGQAEVLLLRRLESGHWEALVRPARRLRSGDHISVAPGVGVRIERVLPA